MISYKVYMFCIGYVVFMVFLLGQIEQYNINSNIDKYSKIEEVEEAKYLTIVWDILTFNVISGTENLPDWFILFVSIPFYALIILFIIDIAMNTINPFG